MRIYAFLFNARNFFQQVGRFSRQIWNGNLRIDDNGRLHAPDFVSTKC